MIRATNRRRREMHFRNCFATDQGSLKKKLGAGAIEFVKRSSFALLSKGGNEYIQAACFSVSLSREAQRIKGSIEQRYA